MDPSAQRLLRLPDDHFVRVFGVSRRTFFRLNDDVGNYLDSVSPGQRQAQSVGLLIFLHMAVLGTSSYQTAALFCCTRNEAEEKFTDALNWITAVYPMEVSSTDIK